MDNNNTLYLTYCQLKSYHYSFFYFLNGFYLLLWFLAALLYSGHLTGSFYIKLTLSPDNAYLACGSADSRAYIYQVGERTQRPLVLSGHTGEVSVPRWSFHDPTCLVTLSDSAQLFVWHMFPAREYTMPESGLLKGEMYMFQNSLLLFYCLLFYHPAVVCLNY